jgi:hypothetical protein
VYAIIDFFRLIVQAIAIASDLSRDLLFGPRGIVTDPGHCSGIKTAEPTQIEIWWNFHFTK